MAATKTKRHLSGRGGNQKPFADARTPSGENIKIPVNRAIVTAWYVANADGGWPERDTVRVDADIQNVQEGETVWLEEMRPGAGMGELTEYRVTETRTIVRQFESRFGQVLRKILIMRVADADEIGELDAFALRGN